MALSNGQTCVALDDGSLSCWGGGASPAVAASTDGARVVQLVGAGWTVARFDDGSVRQLSGAWPPALKPLELGGRRASFIAGSRRGYCAILPGGGAPYTFDASPPTVPADASIVALAVTEYGHACGLDPAGVVTCWNLQGHPEWDDVAQGTAVQVPLGQPATAIGAGDYNGCAALADGTVKRGAIGGLDATQVYAPSLGGSVSKSTGWPAVDLGTRPAP